MQIHYFCFVVSSKGFKIYEKKVSEAEMKNMESRDALYLRRIEIRSNCYLGKCKHASSENGPVYERCTVHLSLALSLFIHCQSVLLATQ